MCYIVFISNVVIMVVMFMNVYVSYMCAQKEGWAGGLAVQQPGEPGGVLAGEENRQTSGPPVGL